MLKRRYDKVISRLPSFVGQNINVRAPLKFKRRLEVKNIKDTSIKVISQLTVYWDKHIFFIRCIYSHYMIKYLGKFMIRGMQIMSTNSYASYEEIPTY